ncbi:MAG: hypothetical protein Q7R31_00640 [Candidatus Levybacteria bacterium]|nr:hypothetical protein [Candidatus Levybacteria bacterium]
MPKIEMSPNGHLPNPNGKKVDVMKRSDGGTTDVVRIKSPSEQQMFLLLKEMLPGWKITYEPLIAWIINPDGTKKGTKPDFMLEKPDSKRLIILEITTQRNNGKDPKEKQKRIMQEAHCEIIRQMHVESLTFLVLYRNHLVRIRRRHPGFDFFNAKLIKRSNQVSRSH